MLKVQAQYQHVFCLLHCSQGTKVLGAAALRFSKFARSESAKVLGAVEFVPKIHSQTCKPCTLSVQHPTSMAISAHARVGPYLYMRART